MESNILYGVCPSCHTSLVCTWSLTQLVTPYLVTIQQDKCLLASGITVGTGLSITYTYAKDLGITVHTCHSNPISETITHDPLKEHINNEIYKIKSKRKVNKFGDIYHQVHDKLVFLRRRQYRDQVNP